MRPIPETYNDITIHLLSLFKNRISIERYVTYNLGLFIFNDQDPQIMVNDIFKCADVFYDCHNDQYFGIIFEYTHVVIHILEPYMECRNTVVTNYLSVNSHRICIR